MSVATLPAPRKAVLMPPAPVTVRARRLGQMLRQLRDGADLTQEEAARRLGWSRPKLVRFETARETSPAGVAAILTLYGSPHATALMQLARDASKRGWWTDFTDFFQGSYIADEDAASSIRAWQGDLIPGLLQTGDYARAVIAADHHGDSEAIHRGVQARAVQRALLSRTDPPSPELTAIIDESVLYRPVGGPRVMAEQLGHLLRQGPNVVVQILPYGVGEHAGMAGRFVILDFPEAQDDDERVAFGPEVYIESVAGDLYPESVAMTQRVIVAYERIASVAASPEQSAKMISAARDRLRKEGS